MADQFETVLKSWSVESAHLARIRLENEGIECHLSNEKTIGMDWGLANATQGVSVIVNQADAERARKLLGEGQSDHSDEDSNFPWYQDGRADEDPDGISEESDQRSSETDNRSSPLASMRIFARQAILFFIIASIVGMLLNFALAIALSSIPRY